MPLRTAEFAFFIWNAQIVTSLLSISVIKYIYEDTVEPITATAELEVEPKYQPKIKRGDTLDIRLKWKDGTTLTNSGIMLVDDNIFDPGKEVFNIGASAYDFIDTKADNEAISYAGSQLRDIVTNQADFFGLTYVPPRGGIIPIVSGFYESGTIDKNTTINDMNKPENYPSRRNKIYIVKGNSRIDVLKEVARMYGYVTNLKLRQLFFLAYDVDLRDARPVINITPSMCSPNLEFRERTKDIYAQAFINYAVYDSSFTRVVDIRQARTWDENTQQITNADYISGIEIYPSVVEGVLRGIGILIEKNASRFSAYLEIDGSPRVVAGAQVTLTGFNNTRDVNPDGKKIDGNWIVIKYRHTFDARGWLTYMEIWKADNVEVKFNDDGS